MEAGRHEHDSVLRAMLASARDDEDAPKLANEYLAMAQSLGFEGHIGWASTMTDAYSR